VHRLGTAIGVRAPCATSPSRSATSGSGRNPSCHGYGWRCQSYSTRFGPYPWSTYTAAVVSDFAVGGYEYPTLVFLGSASEHQAAHETAHQWFYSLVGNDQARDPWLDEALAAWSETAVEPTHSLAFFQSQPIADALRNQLGQPMTFWDRLGFPAFFTGLMAQGVQALAMLGDPTTVDCALRLYARPNKRLRHRHKRQAPHGAPRLLPKRRSDPHRLRRPLLTRFFHFFSEPGFSQLQVRCGDKGRANGRRRQPPFSYVVLNQRHWYSEQRQGRTNRRMGQGCGMTLTK
jgi:hypothetical protein